MANPKATELMARAKEMMERARRIEAAEAEKIGRAILQLRERGYAGIETLDELKAEIEKAAN